MRSSKSRQRNKPNRNRTVGNVVNRVFDSSGPEGKVRGTPQQIIEKYNQLARDAQLAGDRVATENFQQHAEHYLRLLSEAQKEQDARREEQERFNRDRQQDRDRDRPERSGGRESDEGEQPVSQDPAAQAQPDVIGSYDERDIGLVETPESKPQPEPSRRRAHSADRGPRRGQDRAGDAGAGAVAPEPRAEAPVPEASGTDAPEAPAPEAPAPEAAAKRPRKPRAKRAPKAEGNGANGDAGGEVATKAAE
ncbi:DUF4167 domain-containing protein [Roseovarius mucosus]|uniref:DUF4167 domain-containing protein n=1 Tax=Roseovarius mucosus TaxID=215743 RepID=UPI003BAA0310